MAKGAKLTMTMKDDLLRAYLKQMARKGKDVRPYFKRLGAWMAYRSVAKTFKQQGRPKWEELGDYTIAMRHWRAESPNASPHRAFSTRILIDKGDLKKSFTFRARPKQLDVGTAYKGSEKHQFGAPSAKGGTAKAPRRWKRTTVKVPKRQLIGIHPEDEKKAIELAIRYLEKG